MGIQIPENSVFWMAHTDPIRSLNGLDFERHLNAVQNWTFLDLYSSHSLNTSHKMSKEDKFGTVRLIMWLLPFENPIIWSPDFGRLVFRWLTVLVKRKLRRNFFILFFTIGILSTSSIQLFFCGDCPVFDAPSWRHFACRKRGGKTPLSKLHRKWYHNGTL